MATLGTEKQQQQQQPPYTPEVILVTGCGGFILSHAVDHFLARWPRCRVVGLDIMDYCSNMRNLDAARKTGRFTLIKGDIGNLQLVHYILTSERVDTVVHGAAMSHVDNSYGNPVDFVRTNVLGTTCILEACRCYNDEARQDPTKLRTGVRRILHVSTDEVIDFDDCTRPQDESAKMFASSGYSASKAAAEFVCQGYINSHKLPIIIPRGNNCIGTRQYPEKLLPKLILLAQAGRRLPIHGSGKQLRSFLSVFDTCTAFVTILERGIIHEVYHIGSRDEMTVLDVARHVLAAMGVKEEEVDSHLEFVQDRPHVDRRYWVNPAKLQALGWKQQQSFDQVLHECVAWYVHNKDYWGDISTALVAHPRQPGAR